MGKVGKHRLDRRWQTEDGSVFASKLEAIVFSRLQADPRIHVRRCSAEQGDTFAYTTAVRSGSCGACGSSEIVQRRTYTPDLCISPRTTGVPGHDDPKYYLEIKGYFPGAQRNLLRAFLKTGPRIDLRLLLERDGKATGSLTQLEYAFKFLKIPVHVWDGQLPRSWYQWTAT